MEFFTIKQAAQLLHRHPSTVRRYLRKGLRHKKIGGKILIAVEDLKAWIEGYDRVCLQADRFLKWRLSDLTKLNPSHNNASGGVKMATTQKGR